MATLWCERTITALWKLLIHLQGRAYPTGWQTTPNVYDTGNKGEMILPAAMSSGDGNVIVSRQLICQLCLFC
jgi:hypothetical protein